MIIIELLIEIGILLFVTVNLSMGDFLTHAIFCAIVFSFSIVCALLRGEDKMVPNSGQKRHFMTLGHSTVWAFFIGIFTI